MGDVMNFSEYKNEFFAGDSQKALKQLAEEKYNNRYSTCKNATELQKILDSMDKKTANEFRDCMSDEIEKNPQKIKRIIRIKTMSTNLGVTPDYVLQEKKNPFVKKLVFTVIYILCVIAVYAIMLIIKKKYGIDNNNYNTVLALIPSIFLSFGAIPVANNLMNLFRYKKLKSLVEAHKDEFFVEPELEAEPESELEAEPESEIESAADKNEKPIQTDTQINSEEIVNSSENIDVKEEKEPILRSSIISFLIAYYRNRRNASLGVGITLSAIFGALCFAKGALFFSLTALVITVIGSTYFYVQARINLKKINVLGFCIVSDVCTHKYVKRSSEDNSIQKRFLLFKNNGEYHINFNHAGMGIDKFLEGKVYDSVDIDDACYIVMLEGTKKIYMALPEKEYYLGEGEFEKLENKFYPIKNADVESLLRKNDEIQIVEELSDRQKETIEKARRIIRKAKPKNVVLTVFSLIGIFFSVIGGFLDVICFLNLFIQPLWFGIPLVISMVGTIKSKKAFDKVPYGFVGYSELQSKQNSVAYRFLIFLALDIVAYLANFFIIIAVYS